VIFILLCHVQPAAHLLARFYLVGTK